MEVREQRENESVERCGAAEDTPAEVEDEAIPGGDMLGIAQGDERVLSGCVGVPGDRQTHDDRQHTDAESERC